MPLFPWSYSSSEPRVVAILMLGYLPEARPNLFRSQFWLPEIDFLKCQFPFGLPEALPKLFLFSVLTSRNWFSAMSVPLGSAEGSAQIIIIFLLFSVLTSRNWFSAMSVPLSSTGSPAQMIVDPAAGIAKILCSSWTTRFTGMSIHHSICLFHQLDWQEERLLILMLILFFPLSRIRS